MENSSKEPASARLLTVPLDVRLLIYDQLYKPSWKKHYISVLKVINPKSCNDRYYSVPPILPSVSKRILKSDISRQTFLLDKPQVTSISIVKRLGTIQSSRSHLLQTLLVCRQLYHEICPLIYATSRFWIHCDIGTVFIPPVPALYAFHYEIVHRALLPEHSFAHYRIRKLELSLRISTSQGRNEYTIDPKLLEFNSLSRLTCLTSIKLQVFLMDTTRLQTLGTPEMLVLSYSQQSYSYSPTGSLLPTVLSMLSVDGIWLARLLLRLLSSIPESTRVEFGSDNLTLSIKTPYLSTICGWLQAQGVQGKKSSSAEVKSTLKLLQNATVDAQGNISSRTVLEIPRAPEDSEQIRPVENGMEASVAKMQS